MLPGSAAILLLKVGCGCGKAMGRALFEYEGVSRNYRTEGIAKYTTPNKRL
jgi:hypothetical protein